MKLWQLAWCLAFAAWGNIIFLMAANDLWHGDTNIYRVAEFCLQAFTLPAAGSFVALWLLDKGLRRFVRAVKTARFTPARAATQWVAPH